MIVKIIFNESKHVIIASIILFKKQNIVKLFLKLIFFTYIEELMLQIK